MAFPSRFRQRLIDIIQGSNASRAFKDVPIDDILAVLPSTFSLSGKPNDVAAAVQEIYNAKTKTTSTQPGSTGGGSTSRDVAQNVLNGVTNDVISGVFSGEIPSVGNITSNIAGSLIGALGVSVTFDSDGRASVSSSPVNTAISAIINIITGLGVGNGSLQDILEEATTEGLNRAKDAAAGLVGSHVGDLNSLVTGLGGTAGDITDLTGALAQTTAKTLTPSIVSEITGGTTEEAERVIGSLSVNTDSLVTSVNNEINENVNAALSGTGGVGQRVAQEINPDITTITEALQIDTSQSAFDPPFQIGQNVAEWNVSNKRNIEFGYVNTVEELTAEFAAITRGITGVVVHWTKTFSNQNIGSEEINSHNLDLGGDGIEYHYVIRRDGSLQRGRPNGIESNHTTLRNHNRKSLAIAFVGGYNCPTGTENPDKYLSARSLTQAQFHAFELFCKEFLLRYPGGQIIGNNDLRAEYIDPGFDVRDYVDDVFNKKSLFADPFVGNAFEPAEINTTELP